MDHHQINFTIPQLTTARTLMRGHVIEDFDASARMWADQRVVRYISGKPSTREQAWARFLRYAGHWQVMNYGYWLVEDKATGAFIGEVGFANYRREISPPLGDTPEIGWVLSPDAHGRGLATETVAAALIWADQNLTADRTTCIFDPAHSASTRVAEKSGYVKKGMAEYSGKPILVMERNRPS